MKATYFFSLQLVSLRLFGSFFLWFWVFVYEWHFICDLKECFSRSLPRLYSIVYEIIAETTSKKWCRYWCTPTVFESFHKSIAIDRSPSSKLLLNSFLKKINSAWFTFFPAFSLNIFTFLLAYFISKIMRISDIDRPTMRLLFELLCKCWPPHTHTNHRNDKRENCVFFCHRLIFFLFSFFSRLNSFTNLHQTKVFNLMGSYSAKLTILQNINKLITELSIDRLNIVYIYFRLGHRLQLVCVVRLATIIHLIQIQLGQLEQLDQRQLVEHHWTAKYSAID